MPGHPITGVLEKAFAIVGMLQTRRSVTVYDVMDELSISRSIAHKYLTAATIVLPVYAIAKELVKWEQDPDRYRGDLADLAQDARKILEKIRKED